MNWTRTTLVDRSLLLFHPLHFSLSRQLLLVQLDSTVWDSSTDTQTGHTKHCYTMLIPKVYNVCGYTVTAEGTVVRKC